MIDLAALPFNGEAWTHVVLTFERVNSSTETGTMKGFVDGEYLGTLEQENLTLHWQPEKVLMVLGRHYSGDFDDLAVFNRALTQAEVQALYEFPLIDLF